MKKSILSLGLLAGATLSAFALASCAGKTTVKDLEGNDFTIEASEDKEVVSKALILSAKAMTETEKKVYAIGADAKINAEVEATAFDMNIKAKVNANGSIKATMGANKFTSFYDIVKENKPTFTAEQITTAGNEISKNVKFEAYGSVDASVEASSEKKEMKDTVEALNGAKANLSAAAYMMTATDSTPYAGYTEVEGSVAAPVYALIASTGALPEGLEFKASEDGKTYSVASYTKTVLDLDSKTLPEVTSTLAYYQEHGPAALVSKLVPNLNIDAEKDLFDKDFFESNEYKMIQQYVETLGLKITEASGGKVTFAIDFTGKKIKDVGLLALTANGMSATAKTEAIAQLSKLDSDKNYLSFSVTLDVVNGFASQLKVESQDLSFVTTLYGGLPVEKLAGKVSLEVNCYIDGDVKFTKTPDTNKTYVEREND